MQFRNILLDLKIKVIRNVSEAIRDYVILIIFHNKLRVEVSKVKANFSYSKVTIKLFRYQTQNRETAR